MLQNKVMFLLKANDNNYYFMLRDVNLRRFVPKNETQQRGMGKEVFDLRELEAFHEVLSCGNLTAAARQMNVPKSTISRRIRQLEENIGQNLLRREARGLAPTEAGFVFGQYAKQLLELASEGCTAVDALRRDVSGELTIFCHPALMRSWFGGLFHQFIERYQQVNIVLRTQLMPPDQDVSDTVCIWLGELPDTSLRSVDLGVLTQSSYCSPAYLAQHPELASKDVSPADVSKWITLLVDDSAQHLFNLSDQRVFALKGEAQLKVDQFLLQGDAVCRGLGVGIMPDWLVEKRLGVHPDTMLRCLPSWRGPDLPISLLYPHGHVPKRVRTFIEYVQAFVPVEWQSQAV